MSDRPRGWVWPSTARLCHYIIDGRSLCGKWGWLSGIGLSDDPPTETCITCFRKLASVQEATK